MIWPIRRRARIRDVVRRKMHATCADLLRDLELPASPTSNQVIAGLCTRMGQRLGQPVYHRFVRFPIGSVSGLWVATGTEHLVLCEAETTGPHKLAIIGHEFWHMISGHGVSSTVEVAGSGQPSLAQLSPRHVARIVAQRAGCNGLDAMEQEAEMFASVLVRAVGRWLPLAPVSTSETLIRIEETLGPRSRKDWLG